MCCCVIIQTKQFYTCMVSGTTKYKLTHGWIYGRDDQIILTALLMYVGTAVIPGAQRLPWWNTKGVMLAALLHIGPVEFLYYWFHRALHHHFLYSRYHSHHHSSIVTEPITCKSLILHIYTLKDSIWRM
jgi:sterol desaturase/sphingolipid hydroxylase (fatty acid hydroxylase superfamily)